MPPMNGGRVGSDCSPRPPFEFFDRLLNPYAGDNGANKCGRRPTPTAFLVLEVPGGLIRETEGCHDALRSGPTRDQ